MGEESKPESQAGRSILSQINHADQNLMQAQARHDSSQADPNNIRDSIYFDSNTNLQSSVSPSVT